MDGGSSPPTPVTSTVQSTSGPPAYADPFIQQFLQGSQQRYESEAPQFFPEATFVPASSETETGLAAITGQALQGSPIAGEGQRQFQSTLQGDYVNANPYRDAAIGAATDPMRRQFNESTMPSVQAAFSKAGRYGSSALGSEMDRATETINRNIGEVAGGLSFADYGRERGLQNQAIQSSPDFANRRYDDARTLLDVGGAREGYAGNQLQDTMARFDFGQNQPQQKLQEYGSNISRGVYGGTTSGTQTTPYFKQGNAASGALGGALSGGSMGAAFGPYGAAAGAAGGAALGGMGNK